MNGVRKVELKEKGIGKKSGIKRKTGNKQQRDTKK